VLASSRPGDRVLDFFAGSGTLGAVAVATGRRHVLVDDNPEAIAVISGRLGGRGLVSLHCTGGRCGRAPASLSRRVTADEPSGTGAPTQSADPPT
jgi:predicted RNA methylase